MRPDLTEIIQNIKSGSGLPYLILVSNWSQMTERRYVELRSAGVDEFCVSLDFPTSATTTSAACPVSTATSTVSFQKSPRWATMTSC